MLSNIFAMASDTPEHGKQSLIACTRVSSPLLVFSETFARSQIYLVKTKASIAVLPTKPEIDITIKLITPKTSITLM